MAGRGVAGGVDMVWLVWSWRRLSIRGSQSRSGGICRERSDGIGTARGGQAKVVGNRPVVSVGIEKEKRRFQVAADLPTQSAPRCSFLLLVVLLVG